jgi:4-aminobutyrate aminotransferase-like enzyme
MPSVKRTADKNRAAQPPANTAQLEDFYPVRGEGAFLFDRDGRRYVDFTSGWCVCNLGWSVPPVAAAIREFAGPAYVYPHFRYRPWEELAASLVALAGGNIRRAFRATGGSEAVDVAVQAAMLTTGRSRIVAIEDAYHGNTLAARSLGESDLRERFSRIVPSAAHVKPPLDASKLDRVETLLAKDDVAAFIMEPVLCNLGVVIPDREFMRGVERLCRRHGTLLIIDEIATGFGRTGAMFGFELFDLKPDIICLAKAITSGFAPMGATLTTARIAKAMEEIGVYSTYGWHPLSVAAAQATLEVWQRQGADILANVAAASTFIVERVAEFFGDKATLRTQGLAIGIDVGSERRASAIQSRCRENGLLVSAEATAVTLFPPLTIDRDTADAGLKILDSSIGRADKTAAGRIP